MNYIDLIIIILLIIAAVHGVVKGFIYEVTSLIALIAGVWGAMEFSGETQSFLVERLNMNSNYIAIIAFVITFILIIILVHFLGRAVEKAVETIALSTVNRILGLVFSVLKTAFILGILIMVIESFDNEVKILPKNDISESELSQPLRGVAMSTFPFIQNFFEGVKKQKKFFDGSDEENVDKSRAEKQQQSVQRL